MDVFKCSVLLNGPLLCEHCVTGSEGHTPHIPVCFSKLTIYVWLWTVFRRFAEALTPTQSKISLFTGTTLHGTDMLSQIILESSTRHMTSRDKCWGSSSHSPWSSTTSRKGPHGVQCQRSGKLIYYCQWTVGVVLAELSCNGSVYILWVFWFFSPACQIPLSLINVTPHSEMANKDDWLEPASHIHGSKHGRSPALKRRQIVRLL